jgi:hypothetical protein
MVDAPALNEGEVDFDKAVWSLSEWLNGDAMSLVNDEGEKFSPKPYYDAMKMLSASIPCPHTKNLSGTIYRGVGFDDPQDFNNGKVKTALKRMQSWSPDFETAKGFARDYGGQYGVVFSADVAQNRKAILLCISDVLAWLQTNPPEIDDRYMTDHLYQFERYQDQQEVIVKGSQVHINGVKVVKKPRAKKVVDTPNTF